MEPALVILHDTSRLHAMRPCMFGVGQFHGGVFGMHNPETRTLEPVLESSEKARSLSLVRLPCRSIAVPKNSRIFSSLYFSTAKIS